MIHRPTSVKAAIEGLSLACGDLSQRRRKGNFFKATLAKVDEANEALCDHLGEVTGYMEELEAENEALRERVGVDINRGAKRLRTIEKLSECTGECAVEIAKRGKDAAKSSAEEHGVYFDDEDFDDEAAFIVAEKEKGHECSACQNGEAS